MVIHNVYLGNQSIETTVTSSGDAATTWVESILDLHRDRLDSLLVGVDIKWCPTGQYGTTGENPIATLQLCIGRRCLIYQIIHSNNFPEKFYVFLASSQFRFVELGIRSAAARLTNYYPLSIGPNMEDIRELAARKLHNGALRHCGLRDLGWRVKGWQMEDKQSVRLSNWGARRLNDEQIVYAAVDAFLTFAVALELELHH